MISMPDRTFRLAIVEDEALIAMLIEAALVDAGFHVVGTADTVKDAITLIDGDRPDLVLCDIKLHDGDSGLDVAAELARRGIPCLFLSGNCPDPDIGRGLAVGCLLKPFRQAGLIDAIRVALAGNPGTTSTRLPAGMTLY